MTTLHDIRRRIDILDSEILVLFARRMQECSEAAKFKGGFTEDPKREEELRAKWKREAEQLKLSPACALSVLDLVLLESKLHQRCP